MKAFGSQVISFVKEFAIGTVSGVGWSIGMVVTLVAVFYFFPDLGETLLSMLKAFLG